LFDSGGWICAENEDSGTFTKSWHLLNGHTVQSTGKRYTMTMVMVQKAIDGLITEEIIICDAAAIM
jgi:hypothetical protein